MSGGNSRGFRLKLVRWIVLAAGFVVTSACEYAAPNLVSTAPATKTADMAGKSAQVRAKVLEASPSTAKTSFVTVDVFSDDQEAGAENVVVVPASETAVPDYPPLRAVADDGLQHALDAIVEPPALARAVRENRLAIALVDITDVQQPELAMVNGDVMMYAASLPKIAILFGVFDQAATEELPLDAPTLESATRMIRNSSNRAATELFYRVGPKNLATLLQSPRYKLYDRNLGGGLWVGKPYAKKQTWQRDPLHNLSHGATAFQVARFFYLLETGRLVSEQSSAAMKAILGEPAIRHKFVKGLSARPDARIYRKSGTWRTYHSDAGIIERDGKSYIAVVLANDVSASAWLSDLIVKFDDVIHSERVQTVSLGSDQSNH